MSDRLFNKDFTLVVLGQIVSLFGNGILRFALPLYLLKETDSPSLFGVVTATAFLPMIVLSLFGGILADRVNKRNIMVGLDLLTGVIIVVFYFLLGFAPLVPLLIVTLMLLYGIAAAYSPAVQASVPILLNEKNLLSGNAIINQISTLANLLGPIIGGILYSGFGIYPILIVSASAFFIAALMEFFIKIPHEKKPKADSIFLMVKGDLKESFKFLGVEKPIFLKISIIVSLMNLFFSACLIIGLPVLVVKILKLSDFLFGLSEAALGLGGLVGGGLAVFLGKKVSLEKSYVYLFFCSVSSFLMAIPLFFGFPTMFSYIIIVISSFLSMAFSTLFVIRMITLLQKESPSHLVGKVMATVMALSMCATPVGQVVYGFLFQWFRSEPWVPIMVAALTSALMVFFSRKTFHELSKFN